MLPTVAKHMTAHNLVYWLPSVIIVAKTVPSNVIRAPPFWEFWPSHGPWCTIWGIANPRRAVGERMQIRRWLLGSGSSFSSQGRQNRSHAYSAKGLRISTRGEKIKAHTSLLRAKLCEMDGYQSRRMEWCESWVLRAKTSERIGNLHMEQHCEVVFCKGKNCRTIRLQDTHLKNWSAHQIENMLLSTATAG